MKRKTGIYKIINTITGKVYVGSSKDMDKRWIQHKNHLSKDKHHSKKLQNSVNKHGLDNFIFEVVEECSKDILIEREQYWIDLLGSYKTGYNCNTKAGITLGMLGKKHSEDTKSKMRKKRGPMSDNTKKKLSKLLSGRKHSKEVRDKMRKTRINFKHSEETKEKMRLIAIKNKNLVNNKNMATHGHSEETKEKISKSKLGKRLTKKRKSPKPFTEEHRKKLSEKTKLYWQNKKSTF